MLQLLDLARENAELKSELTRIRREAEALRCLLSVVRQTWAKCSCADRADQITADVPGLRGTGR
jgi:hypothetical protein